MAKTKLELAKELFDEVYNKAKKTTAKQAEEVEEPKKGDERPDLEDGEHVEGDYTITVVDKVITEVVKKDDKMVVEEEDNTDPVVDPIVEPDINEGLADIIIEKLNLAGVDDGSFNIYGSILNGKLSWGDVYTTDYKVLMAKQTEEVEAKDKELVELKLQLECKDKVIATLSEEEEVINLNPTEVAEDKMSTADYMKSKLSK